MVTKENKLTPETKDKDAVVSYHYFTLKRPEKAGDPIGVTRVRHKMEMGTNTWVLKPIFGNDEHEKLKTINLNSFKNECIMCFDEKTDIMMYPCRHLSIGFECAQRLRNSPKCRECPVCRATIERFVRINI